jgi:hypothetical protein
MLPCSKICHRKFFLHNYFFHKIFQKKFPSDFFSQTLYSTEAPQNQCFEHPKHNWGESSWRLLEVDTLGRRLPVRVQFSPSTHRSAIVSRWTRNATKFAAFSPPTFGLLVWTFLGLDIEFFECRWYVEFLSASWD